MADARVAALLTEVGATAEVDVAIEGRDPVLASRLPVGEAAAVAIGAGAALAAEIWRNRTGEEQSVRVGVDAAAGSLISFLLQRIDGAEAAPDMARRSLALTALYEARDGRWIHLHGGFPHLATGTRACSVSPTMRIAIRSHRGFGGATRWSSRTRSRRSTVALRWCVRARKWDAHPQGRALAPLGRVVITKVAHGEPLAAGRGDRPLAGVRVLDLTRVLAGPTVGRTLAEHGAEVLLVNSPKLPNVDGFVIDTSHGKRSTRLDLDLPEDAARLRTLASGADVFVQGYRPGALGAAASAPRTSPRRTRGSCTSTSLAMATRVRGRRVRGGNRWRSPRPGSRRHKAAPPARASSPPRRATTSPGTSARSARWPRCNGARPKGELPSVGLVVSDGYVDPIAGRRPRSR